MFVALIDLFGFVQSEVTCGHPEAGHQVDHDRHFGENVGRRFDHEDFGPNALKGFLGEEILYEIFVLAQYSVYSGYLHELQVVEAP